MNVIASGKQQITPYSGNKYIKGDYIVIEDAKLFYSKISGFNK